jgi:glycosyltransferase involved in cell wall biosynthesis
MTDRDSGPGVSCILPARNEAASLPRTVAEWTDALARIVRDYELVVVDDGSTDDTPAVLRELGERHARLRVVTHGTAVGYGAAIANGFAQAAFPLLFFTDADGQFDPQDFPPLLAALRSADVAVGYRVRRAETGLRRVLSTGYNALTRRVMGVSLRDLNCAFKLMHRDTFARLGIEATGFCFNAELARNARLAGMTVVEVPVRHRPRVAGRSTVRLVHVLTTLWELVQLRARRRRVAAIGHRRPDAA